MTFFARARFFDCEDDSSPKVGAGHGEVGEEDAQSPWRFPRRLLFTRTVAKREDHVFRRGALQIVCSLKGFGVNKHSCTKPQLWQVACTPPETGHPFEETPHP
ncbi:hypothetical protein CDAR_585411 [Caerostris darwini]|uniref:Uncharacterized protein n=1 Tax=Caerostris darwini TaxID=1538125 RepID=A0AAV4X3X3_9ARAC|nr:hypothetical protein CDAR_585411 [Caerostris darwini]